MGGINCQDPPPPPPPGTTSSGEHQAYVQALAAYSHSLFRGAARFYAGNAHVEAAVLGANGAKAEASIALEDSAQSFVSAQSLLGSVASLAAGMFDPLRIDFASQIKTLAEVARIVSAARLELLMIDGCDQQALWDRPALTTNFVAALRAIATALEWQAHFATAAQQQALTMTA